MNTNPITADQARKINEDGGQTHAMLDGIFSGITMAAYNGANQTGFHMHIGPDWGFISTEVIRHGFNVETIGLELHISW